MDQDKLSLSTEDIKVDFLRFNFQFIDKSKIQEIANYLWEEYSCNSVFIDKKKLIRLLKNVDSVVKENF